jgi:hypothetical protein
VTSLKEARANMPFDFSQDAGHARLAQSDPSAGTVKVQLFCKSTDGAEIIEFE